MLSECNGHFEDADKPHKMDEILYTAVLPMDIDVILDSMGDSEFVPTPSTPHPPHFPYENADFTSILGSVSIIP
jgi:hypothetical protein